jgi:hypothetical protein
MNNIINNNREMNLRIESRGLERIRFSLVGRAKMN